MSFVQRLKSTVTPAKSAQQLGNETDQVWRQTKPGQSYQTVDRAASVLAFVGLISAVQALVQTWKKQALYHMPGWLTLAEQVQTPYHARVLKPPVNRTKLRSLAWK